MSRSLLTQVRFVLISTLLVSRSLVLEGSTMLRVDLNLSPLDDRSLEPQKVNEKPALWEAEIAYESEQRKM